MNKVISVQQCKKCVDIYDEDLDNNDSDVFSNDKSSFSIYQQEILSKCENEKCIEVSNEIEEMEEECDCLKKKINLMDKAKNEEFFDISSKLSEVCKNVNEMRSQLEPFEGENLSNYSYDQLNTIELSLLSLLTKVRKKEAKMESDFLSGKKIIPEDKSNKCKKCKINDLNCIISPCSHVVICIDCAMMSTKCPICLKYIDYYDKVYLPEM